MEVNNNMQDFAAQKEQSIELMSRSATDDTFRQALIERPQDALAEFFGSDRPAIFSASDVTFVETEAERAASGSATCFVLPEFVGPDGHLSEEQLESVSGGYMWLLVLAAEAIADWEGTSSSFREGYNNARDGSID